MLISLAAGSFLFGNFTTNCMKAGEIDLATMRHAREHSIVLKKQESEIRSAGNAVSIAKAALNPEVFLEISAGLHSSHSRLPHTSKPSENLTGYHQIKLSFEQEIFDGGEKKSRLQAMKAAEVAEQSRLVHFEQQVLMNAAKAFLNVQYARSMLRHAQTNLNFMKKQLALELQRFDLGQATLTQLSRTRAYKRKMEIDNNNADLQLRKAELIYEKLVGKKFPADTETISIASLLPNSMYQASKIVLNEHPLLSADDMFLEEARHALEQVQAAKLPKLYLDAQISKGRGIDYYQRNNHAVGLRIKVPLFNGKSIQSKMSQKKEAHYRVQLDRDIHLRELLSNLEIVFETVVTARTNSKIANSAKESAKLAFESALQERDYLLKTTPEMIEMHFHLSRAVREYLETERALMVAEFALLSSIGRLNMKWLDTRTKPADVASEREYIPGELPHVVTTNGGEVIDHWRGMRGAENHRGR